MNTTNHALHVYFAQRNQQAFQRLLDSHRQQTALSSSAPKSWSRLSGFACSSVDVNARDQYGRTVLHLACSASDSEALEYVRLLLASSTINVNLPDKESSWSALHRALYAGNIPACVLLLNHKDIDLTLKDAEGYGVFDLYHSTIQFHLPKDISLAQTTEIYTWGSNRNATLGHGDSGDRVYPEQIVLRQSSSQDLPNASLSVQHVAMAKLHSVLLTSDPSENLWICGFGSTSRLASSVHTQFEFKPVAHGLRRISSVALGQDHTIAIADNGDLYTWGSNRYSQLGYPLEYSKGEEPVQSTPRKVSGLLKKDKILGAAACRTASACWSTNGLFTWGTNNGQLGYDNIASPVQVLPRRVPLGETLVVQSVALTETAMICLVEHGDVVCFNGDTHFRVNFSYPPATQSFISKHKLAKPHMSKVVASDGVFASLSSAGDIFTFSVPSASDGVKFRDKTSPLVKPQLVWSRRKQFSAAQDVALGSDGTLILCTASGDVFTRSRNNRAAGGKTFRFQHVPYIHRILQVSANSSGSYAALSAVCPPQSVSIITSTLGHDFSCIQPWIQFPESPIAPNMSDLELLSPQEEGEDVMEDKLLSRQISLANHFVDVFLCIGKTPTIAHDPIFSEGGADLVVDCGTRIVAHQVIVLARCPALLQISTGGQLNHGSIFVTFVPSGKRPAELRVKGCRFATILMLLSYIYSDEVSPLWDRNLILDPRCRLSSLGNKLSGIKDELRCLSELLGQTTLSNALQLASFNPPSPSLPQDIGHIYQMKTLEFLSDVRIHFADHILHAHSTILRARSSYFASFFDEDVWTKSRRQNGILDVWLKHMRWRAASVAFANIYYGLDHIVLPEKENKHLIEDSVDFYFEVLTIANELLLDHLMLISSNAILDCVNFCNIGAILCETSYLQVTPLKTKLHEYIASNLEAILEFRLLDDLSPDILRELMKSVQVYQRTAPSWEKWHYHVSSLLEKHCRWLDSQDLPIPLLPTARTVGIRPSPKLSPESPIQVSLEQNVLQPPMLSPLSSPVITAVRDNSNDGVFDMDDEPSVASAHLNLPKSSSLAWRTGEVGARHDFKAIMSETAREQVTLRTPPRSPSSLLSKVPGSANLDTGGTRRVLDNSMAQRKKHASPSHSSKPRSTSKIDTRPSLGPTFTPARVPPSLQREMSSSSKQAWSTPPTPPTQIPVQDSPDQRTLSFIAIQEQQRQQTVPVKGKLSLREIQEQEAADRLEIDFLQWWAAEEEKLRLANQATTHDQEDDRRRNKTKAGGSYRRQRRVKGVTDEPKVLQESVPRL